MSETLPVRVRFGAFELDLKAGELCLGDLKIILQDQPLQILLMLVERNGGLVTRDEIQKKLWPDDTIVEFGVSINQAIMKLRRALNDSAGEPQYIETVARRGYRLKVPVEQVEKPAEPASLTGKQVSHYRVLEVIGGGGMGVVYRAEDLRLGRAVALKFLPVEVGNDPRALERFQREAQTASALDYPNICPIHELEEYEGRPFIVMQLLEGQTLRDWLASSTAEEQSHALTQLLDIAMQVAAGLQAAHEKGIIHRDIKPANIFLTNKGVAKILDFGLAKLMAAGEEEQAVAEIPIAMSSRAEAASVAAGVEGSAVPRLGTTTDPSTACPTDREDAAGKRRGHFAQDNSAGMDDDNRVSGHVPSASSGRASRRAVTDSPDDSSGIEPATERALDSDGFTTAIANVGDGGTGLHLTRTGFAFGTAAYMSPEQIRGETLDARTDLFSFGLVLYEMFTGQRAFSGETAAIVQDAIVNQQPIPVRELNSALPAKLVSTIDKALEKDREQRYQTASDMQADLEILAGRTQHGRFRRHWKLVVTTSIVLATVVGGILYWRSHRAVHLSGKDTIVLADFANSTGNSVFDGTLKQALAIQLEQSPFLNVLSDKQVSATLKLMQHPDTERLTQSTAQAVCLRANCRALVAGSISSIGDRYRIGLKTMDCQSGDTLAAAESELADRNEVLSALATAASQLRQRLGESLDSVQKFNQPLQEATTSSLEALQAYTQGRKKQAEEGEAAAIPYFKLAVDLDPDFAYAYVALGTAHYYLYEYSQAATDLKKAFDLRERVSRRERFAIEGYYYDWVTGEMDKMGQTHMEWAQTYPRDYIPRLRLNAYYRFLGQFENAVSEGRRALELAPDNAACVYALMIAYVRMNRLEDAKRIYEEARAQKLDSPLIYVGRYVVAFLQRDEVTMRDLIASARGKPLTEELLLTERSRAQAYYGKLKEAREFSTAAIDMARKAGSPERAAQWKTFEALTEADVGNIERARRAAAVAVSLSAGPDVSANAALAFALSGNFAQAKTIADNLAHEHPLNIEIQYCIVPPVRALTALGRNKPHEAVDILVAAIPYDLGDAFLFPAYIRGLAYLQAGNGPLAAVEFEKLLDHPGILESIVLGALSHLQLGRAQAMMGDKTAARKSYQEFLALWKDADPDIPIYQQAKAEYARLLQ